MSRYVSLCVLGLVVLLAGVFPCSRVARGQSRLFQRADANADGKLDISDPVSSLQALFLGSGEITCRDAADSNDDGAVDVSDSIYTLGFLFLGGPEPPGPLRICGVDATPDGLDCVSYPPCTEIPAFAVHRNSDGSVNGMNVTTVAGTLFVVEERDVLDSFKSWIAQNAGDLGLAPIDGPEALRELRETQPPADFGALEVHRFGQTYRGHEIVGPEQIVSLTVTKGGRAVSFTGTIADSRVDY